MSDLINCPVCNKASADAHYIDVDIGVGTMQHLEYIECPRCGPKSPCFICGGWDNHAVYCKYLNENAPCPAQS